MVGSITMTGSSGKEEGGGNKALEDEVWGAVAGGFSNPAFSLVVQSIKS